jgi:uncharacterized SAM-binding protein YcdF (DUF218 family)
MMLTSLLKTLLLPPSILIVSIFLGVVLRKRYPWRAGFALFFGLMGFWALSLPFVSASLHQWLEAPYIIDPATYPETQKNIAATSAFLSVTSLAVTPPEGVEAIVVLGAGRHYAAQEYGGGDTLSHSALWRLRYGAYLAKRWDLPVVVSGGVVKEYEVVSEAKLAADFLQKELGVSTVWLEAESRNTWENALNTKVLLDSKGINKVVLVTHAYHMRRSSYAFDQAAVNYIPMPTGFLGNQAPSGWWENWLPSAKAFRESYLALHEYLGLVFYRMK